jgi:lysophospholipase L1-like esterase
LPKLPAALIGDGWIVMALRDRLVIGAPWQRLVSWPPPLPPSPRCRFDLFDGGNGPARRPLTCPVGVSENASNAKQRILPMSTPRAENCFIVQQVGVIALCFLGMPACAQGPETVVPEPRDGSWMELHRRYVERAKKGSVDLLFLGDSITQGWNENTNPVWKRFYGPRKAVNFGIGGDRTQHVLWRIQNGELDGIKPKVVVLMIGTNNASSSTPDEIAQGIKAIVRELRQRLPEAKILLLGVFPRSQKPDALRERLKSVNERIAKLDDGEHIKFLDIGKAFLEPDGTIAKVIMPDYLHLTPLGYRRWAEAMEPTLWSLLDEPGLKTES